MNKYYELVVMADSEAKLAEIEALSFDYGSMGTLGFTIDEALVDEILGDRSYSGGDLPDEVIFEVDQIVTEAALKIKIYFESQKEAHVFNKLLSNNYGLNGQIEECEDQDWNEEWRKHYSPIIIDDEFQIVPSWSKDSALKNAVYIYPGMGFGTGNHETTFLCLKLLRNHVSLDKTIENCLDFGSGSGILGLAIYHFSKRGPIDLYDIDENAMRNAVQNIEYNDYNLKDFNLILPEHRAKINKKYNVVFANILQNILLIEASFLVNSLIPNGHLIVSGLLRGQELEVIESYTKFNPKLIVIEVATKGDWVAVLFREGV